MSKPRRYRLPGGFLARLRADFRWLRGRAQVAVLELTLFGPLWGTPLRQIATKLNRWRLVPVEAQFDPAFYQRQFSERRRRKVKRAPLLHYILIGWLEDRAPNADMDPVFYRQLHGDGPKPLGGPLLHYARIGASRSAARNGVESQDFRRTWQESHPTALTFNHGRGGGSSHFLDIFEHDLWRQGCNVLRLRAVQKAPSMGVISDRAEGGENLSVAFDLNTDLQALAEFCRRRGVNRLVVNHLIDRPSAMMKWIGELGRALSCPYDVILHDYYALCPRLDLVDGNGRFCGIAPPEVCAVCVRRDGSEAIEVDPLIWRSRNLAFLAEARTVFVPSRDMVSRMSPYLPNALQLWTPEHETFPPERQPSLARQSPLRIAILGGLNVPKGLKVVASLAEAAGLARAPLDVTLVGPASDPDILTRRGVRVLGPYAPQDIDALIDQAAPHIVFLPAIWPETWSFVLTVALRRGLPIFAFDIGAPAERLRHLGRRTILELELAERPDDLLARFLELRAGWIE